MPAADLPPLVLIICGPAGSGKTTLCERLLAARPDSVKRLVTTTSRRPREGESDGIDYHFLPADVFRQEIQKGAFIEWAIVHGRYYGARKSDVMKLLATGKDVLLNIDIQGAQAWREERSRNPELCGRIHTVFIKPASMDQLKERLHRRGTDNEAEIAKRLETARREIAVADEFDKIIISGTREEDFRTLLAYYDDLRRNPASRTCTRGADHL